MKHSRIFPAGLLALMLAGGALRLPAGHDEEEGDPRFRRMDTDGDGRLSRSEYAFGVNAVFAEMDRDHDGAITAAEMDAHLAQRKDAAIRFAVATPAVNDGQAVGSGAARADGSASQNDVANARGAVPAELSAAEKIRPSDRNGDGRLSAAEHSAGAIAFFARLDADGDGYLSRLECEGGITLAAHR